MGSPGLRLLATATPLLCMQAQVSVASSRQANIAPEKMTEVKIEMEFNEPVKRS